ncbi:MAG: hypothetical protein BRC29_01625 [Nanohaloarchaea archaeon SW_7_43_1]|nr:MAG: hypothetical protein BRC29_01625 [Nanohaloarchaea archaeon SW_7_43_1]
MQFIRQELRHGRKIMLIALIVAAFGGFVLIQNNGVMKANTRSLYSEQVHNATHQAQRADLIVTGTVEKVSDGKWSTPNNRRPENITNENLDNIHHDVRIDVNETIKGEDRDWVTVRIDSGTVDGYTNNKPSADYDEGEKVLVFLYRWEGNYKTVADNHGKFDLSKEIIDRENAPEKFQQSINTSSLIEQLRETYN